ncbi:MAG: coiled coil domain-containing protein [Methylomonas lenta]|nr:coiled coil domain-containing protein [Methylomonas lenta]
MKTKNEYIEILATELKQLSAEIDVLTEKADKAANLVQQNCAADLEVLRTKQAAAVEKMKELEESRGEAWEELKHTADTVWDELRTGLSAVADKFK